jgi:transcriptional regulator with XRE-family HTH domain
MNRKTESPSVLAQRIVACREQCGLKQIELAVKAGVSPRTMAALELGESKDPQILTLKKVADALQVSLDYLIGRPAYAIRRPSRPKAGSRETVTALLGRTA